VSAVPHRRGRVTTPPERDVDGLGQGCFNFVECRQSVSLFAELVRFVAIHSRGVSATGGRSRPSAEQHSLPEPCAHHHKTAGKILQQQPPVSDIAVSEITPARVPKGHDRVSATRLQVVHLQGYPHLRRKPGVEEAVQWQSAE